MAVHDTTSFERGNVPISHEDLQQITSHLHDLEDSSHSGAKSNNESIPKEQQQPETGRANGSLDPPKPEQLSGLFQFLDDYYWSANAKSSDDSTDGTMKRPSLLNICSGNGLAAVAASRFNLCSQTVGLDANPLTISNSMKLAFQQKVFHKCHFFQTELVVDPKLLLDNPHFMADKINEADVVFLYASPTTIRKLIPLLALLSAKKKETKFVTLMNHLPNEFAVCPELISGTELCAYNGVVDDRMKEVQSIPRPPEPVDADEIDKGFARSSIRHALPERF